MTELTIDALEIAGGLIKTSYDKVQRRRLHRYLKQLGENSGLDREIASRAVAEFADSPKGRRLLMTTMEDLLFGTEDIVLAALARLAARQLADPNDTFPGTAGRAIRDLLDNEIILFLLLLSAADCLTNLDGKPYQVYSCSLETVCERVSDVGKLGFDQSGVVSVINAMVTRRILLPDLALGRVGGGPPGIIFGLSTASWEYYQVLYDAALSADDLNVRAYAIRPPEHARSDLPLPRVVGG